MTDQQQTEKPSEKFVAVGHRVRCVYTDGSPASYRYSEEPNPHPEYPEYETLYVMASHV